jgi:hypothetical protein
MIARFKDLCMDAADAPALAGFWARILHGEVIDTGDGDARVDVRPGGAGPESIWVNQVPEPRTGKTRVHLDLRLPDADPAALLAAGARLVREPDAEVDWWVLADPDGNQFCAFPPGTDKQRGVFELVVDSADPAAQARWWAGVVGGQVGGEGEDYTYLTGAAGFPWGSWIFDPVSERKRVKNRVHWDVDRTDRDPGTLIAAGAVLLREPDDRVGWWVLADPEGNEFCAFPPRPTQ